MQKTCMWKRPFTGRWRCFRQLNRLSGRRRQNEEVPALINKKWVDNPNATHGSTGQKVLTVKLSSLAHRPWLGNKTEPTAEMIRSRGSGQLMTRLLSQSLFLSAPQIALQGRSWCFTSTWTTPSWCRTLWRVWGPWLPWTPSSPVSRGGRRTNTVNRSTNDGFNL